MYLIQVKVAAYWLHFARCTEADLPLWLARAKNVGGAVRYGKEG